MKEKTVSIVGCGWLGFPLGKHLLARGYAVKGSTTSPGKMDVLRSAGITPTLLHLNPSGPAETLRELCDTRVMFLNIPFRRQLLDPYVYLKQINTVARAAESSPVEFIIFASSTSVYPDTLATAVEDGHFLPDADRAKVLLDIERELLANRNFQATVLRFGGLYGGERKIGRFLAGKKDLGEGNAPVNLVHLDDGVAVVTQIIEEDIRGEVFNVCSDAHPTRRDLYASAAAFLRVSPPEFSGPAGEPAGKIVSNAKLKKRLRYQFIHPDPSVFV